MSFTVYRSSAGSGKTFSLVREYLNIVLKSPSGFRHILAITFTHKAANEMRERVMLALRNLSRTSHILPEGSLRHLQLSLMEETGLEPEELSRRAQEAISLILHHYSEFSIGTIDSFSHRIIRSFAHDFGLPVSFTVELDADELLTIAVDLLLEQAGSNKELTTLLVSFLESRMEDDMGWNIDQLLISFAGLLLKEDSEPYIKKLAAVSLPDFHRIANLLNIRVRNIETEFRELGNSGLELISRNGIATGSFYHGKTGIPGFMDYLANARMDKLEPNSRVITTLDEDKWVSPTAPQSDADAIHRIKKELRDICQQAALLKDKHSGTYHLYVLLLKTIYPLAVLNETGRMMEGFKRQQNMIHISEFNSRIANIVMREPVPFIYERTGEKYHHILIDEFQDTSRMQWLNFVPLIENALAGGHFNLVVGDGKQAIYRWRNGDVTQFTSLPLLPGRDDNALIRQRESLFTHYFTEHHLDSNYRSLPEIVSFNNHFFRWLSQHLDTELQGVYKDLEQKAALPVKGGYICLDLISRTSGGVAYSENTINRTEEIIRQLLAAGYFPQDIAILCRKNSQAGKIARELIVRNINVVSSESLLLSFSPEVRFLTDLIRFLSEPANPVIRASIIQYLYVTERIRHGPGGLHDLLSAAKGTTHQEDQLLRVLNDNGFAVDQDHLLSLPVYDLCEHLIRIFGLNRQPDPYIQFFLDAVVSFTDNKNHHTGSFPEWWEQHKMKLSIVVPEGVDAVRVMTIHKAKGLEFPVVILPFADESLTKMSKGYLWVDLPKGDVNGLKSALLPAEAKMLETPYKSLYKEELDKSLLDLINVWYVAMTRPVEKLYMITAPPPAKPGEMNSVPVFFASYLQFTGMWEEGRTRYEYGLFTPKKPNKPSEHGTIRSLSSMPSSDWSTRIKIRQKAPEYWDMADPAGKVDFGSRIHSILAGVKVAADIDHAVGQSLLNGTIAHEEQPFISDMLEKIVMHPQLARLFKPDAVVRTEPEIIEQGGESFRPDRVVIDGEDVVVIDYKTGSKSPAHREQIRKYGQLLREMGYTHVKKLLVYLKAGVEVVEVNE